MSRAVDGYLDLSEFRVNLAGSCSHTGGPSIDPELMARMLIIGDCYGMRLERTLCEDVSLNLAYRCVTDQASRPVREYLAAKRTLKLGQLRLRGFSGAHDAFLLAAMPQNLRRMAKKLLAPKRELELPMS